MTLNFLNNAAAQIVIVNDHLEWTRAANSVLHFGRAAAILRLLQVKVMEELTGAQLIAEALKAQVSLIIQKFIYTQTSKAPEPSKPLARTIKQCVFASQ